MCLLSKYLVNLEINNEDALVIQLDNDDILGSLDFTHAEALICRIDTEQGESWCYHPLLYVNEKVMAMPGTYGTMTDVVKAAKFTFGDKLDEAELLGISYTNPKFPKHLFSHLS